MMKETMIETEVTYTLEHGGKFYLIEHDGDEFKIVEMSYCWSIGLLNLTIGYWDFELNWHPGEVNSSSFMVQDFIKEIENK